MLGIFELYIIDGNILMNLLILSRMFLFFGIKYYQILIECENVIRGEIIVVKKMDGGLL